MSTKDHSDTFILFILSVAQFFGLSLWFAPNAVFDQLVPLYNLSDIDLSLISTAVIAGFIVGSLISAFFNLPDIIESQNLFFWASILGGLSNSAIIFTNDFWGIWIFRFFTGIFLSGIYPVGMKLTASHFKENRGLAIGVLLSALTAGSGLPYLFNLFGEPDWKIIILVVSFLSFTCGILVIVYISEGPFIGKNSSFQFKAIGIIYKNRSVRLANFGYFGHMWELYPFWVWIPIYLKESYFAKHVDATSRDVLLFVSLGSFTIFFAGAIANIVGGYFSDKFGRAQFNILMLSISGFSGLIIGLFFEFPIISLLISIIWGITIIPDSPQYSTLVSELSEQDLVGTALTIQTAIGFTITMIIVQVIPFINSLIGWRWTFMLLSLGPIFGIWSMYRLIKITPGK